MNQYLIYALIALGIFTAGGVTGWHEKALRVPALLEAQQKADNKQCNIEKQITKETNDAQIKHRDDIIARRDALKLQHPARCLPVASKAKPAASDGTGARSYGIDSSALRDYAADFAFCQSEVEDLWSFIDKVWAENGQ